MKTALLIEFSLCLDLLAVSIESGLDFSGALKELLPILPQSEISQKLSLFLSQIKLGHRKEKALLIFEKSWKHPSIENFCQTLIHGWKQGISISDLLKEQAEYIRTETFFQMEKEIHKKQLKLLMPLFLLVVPAVMIVLLMPLMIQLIGDI